MRCKQQLSQIAQHLPACPPAHLEAIGRDCGGLGAQHRDLGPGQGAAAKGVLGRECVAILQGLATWHLRQ